MPANLESQIKSAEEEWLDLWKSGPSRLRWNRIPLQVGDTAPDFELQDSTGAAVHLRDFWNYKPALLLFWRHYGCSCGIERAKRLQNEYADYLKLGANVVVIGQGEPERAAGRVAHRRTELSRVDSPGRLSAWCPALRCPARARILPSTFCFPSWARPTPCSRASSSRPGASPARSRPGAS